MYIGQEPTSDSLGKFNTLVKADQAYVLKAYHEGYVTQEQIIDLTDQKIPLAEMKDMDEDIIINKKIVLLPIVKNLVIDFLLLNWIDVSMTPNGLIWPATVRRVVFVAVKLSLSRSCL